MLGDFNIDLLKNELSDSIKNFIDTLSSKFFLPPILLPLTSKTSTLIDNIFSNSTSLEEIESGNVTSTLSDHLPQFIFLKDFFSKIPATKSNILRHDWRKFESNKFISDFDQTDREQILCSEKSDVNLSMNQYLSKIDSLLETHAPLKKLNKKELKFLTKPWITQGLQNSIKKKNNVYSEIAKCKNQKLKEFYHSNTRPTEISCPHSSKWQKKNISLSFLMKTLKMLRRLS